MNIIPRIEFVKERKLVGKKLGMTFSNNRTFELWRSFMPRRKEIKTCIGTDLFSMQLYNNFDFNNFNPNLEFEKWAAVEVIDVNDVPDEMEAFTLPAGMYAVFHYKGLNTDTSIFEYIFRRWLPESEYDLDNRPHFEILGEKYRNNDPSSEEDIYIPVKNK